MPFHFRSFAAIVTATLLAAQAGAQSIPAAQPRAIWWWASRDNPWGTEQVVGNPTKEDAVLKFLRAWNVNRLYCSYTTAIKGKPELIRTWNQRLHAAGKSPQLLLSENTWIFPHIRPNLLTHVQNELIDCNAAATNAGQRFDGLHFDIEPQGMPEWKTKTPAERKELLLLLRDTFKEVRAYLDEHSAKDLPVYADLPVWFDLVGKPVGWESEADRNAWFDALSHSLAGITLMAYERNTAPRIESGVGWTYQHYKGEVRLGLEASVGPGKTWKTFDDLIGMIQAQERLVPPRAVDIHAFAQFHDLAPATPAR